MLVVVRCRLLLVVLLLCYMGYLGGLVFVQFGWLDLACLDSVI